MVRQYRVHGCGARASCWTGTGSSLHRPGADDRPVRQLRVRATTPQLVSSSSRLTRSSSSCRRGRVERAQHSGSAGGFRRAGRPGVPPRVSRRCAPDRLRHELRVRATIFQADGGALRVEEMSNMSAAPRSHDAQAEACGRRIPPAHDVVQAADARSVSLTRIVKLWARLPSTSNTMRPPPA